MLIIVVLYLRSGLNYVRPVCPRLVFFANRETVWFAIANGRPVWFAIANGGEVFGSLSFEFLALFC